MKHPNLLLATLLVSTLSLSASGLRAQEKGGSDDFGPYEPARDWIKPVRPGYIERGVSVFAESPDRIYFTSDIEVMPQRGFGGAGPAAADHLSPDHHWIMVLDRNGNVIEEWKQWDSLFKMPHAVKISPYDPEKSVWVIEREKQHIFKFSHDGKKLLMTLGEKGVIKEDDTHFGRPAGIAFLPDGSFLIADGYDNTRVIKFDESGKRLQTWGTKGKGPGQFNVQVHDIALDQNGHMYVGDRGNERVQVFDASFKFLDEWDHISRPSFVWVTKDKNVWVVAGSDNRLAEYDMNGKLLTQWGVSGSTPGKFDDPGLRRKR